MEFDFIRQRITELRLKKGVSESRMSSDLDHNKNYIQHIVSWKSNPSVQEPLYIIDYLEVSPCMFFDEGNQHPILTQKIIDGLQDMPESDFQFRLIPLQYFDIINMVFCTRDMNRHEPTAMPTWLESPSIFVSIHPVRACDGTQDNI